jgi:hypothetical protein
MDAKHIRFGAGCGETHVRCIPFLRAKEIGLFAFWALLLCAFSKKNVKKLDFFFSKHRPRVVYKAEKRPAAFFGNEQFCGSPRSTIPRTAASGGWNFFWALHKKTTK